MQTRIMSNRTVQKHVPECQGDQRSQRVTEMTSVDPLLILWRHLTSMRINVSRRRHVSMSSDVIWSKTCQLRSCCWSHVTSGHLDIQELLFVRPVAQNPLLHLSMLEWFSSLPLTITGMGWLAINFLIDQSWTPHASDKIHQIQGAAEKCTLF